MPNEEQVVAYFVRHGETSANAEGRFRGTKTDYPLSKKGIGEAQEAREFLKDKPIGDAWTSDKDRAEHTSQIVLEPRGMAASPTASLHPLDVGYLSGEKKDDHSADIKYFQDHPEVEIPGGQSIAQFRARVKPPILQAIRRGIENGKPSVVFGHASIIHEVGNLIHNDHTVVLVKPGGVAQVTYDGTYFRAKAIFKAAAKSAKDSILA
jgi:broad specificity phosphatase PhoE